MIDPAKRAKGLARALDAARAASPRTPLARYDYQVGPPKLAAGVAPEGIQAPVLAMDDGYYSFVAGQYPGGGFPGFSYLSQLATRAEYRAFASALSTEITREWIEFSSKQDDDDSNSEKIKQIEAEFKRLDVQGVIQRAAEHDSLFGRAQIFINITGQDRKLPLILDPRTVKPGSLDSIATVEAMWTTPASYNALDPAAADFYKPPRWFMLGQEVHATRLLTIITRPLPDMLKPSFNFAGMSMSQLAEPYVDNWLRTRQSVSDLINNFSITVLSTAMDQMLQDGDDGNDLFKRIDLFTSTRSNKGMMVVDGEREEILQVNTPLSGLHELQAQSQEQMCSVSRMPAIVLTGISPGGLNASSDSEIRVFYDWIAAQQEAYWRKPMETILQCVQLSLFGEIDPDIEFTFVPLYQMTPKELSEIRKSDCDADCAYVEAGIIDPTEVRERLAHDKLSGYDGLDTSIEIVPPEPQPAPGEQPPAGLEDDAKPAQDEQQRADNGEFGSGGGGSSKSEPNEYEASKQKQKALEDDSKAAAKKLDAFPKGPMNLTPNDVKATPEYQQAKKESDIAFRKLQAHNAEHVTKYKKEYAAERKARGR